MSWLSVWLYRKALTISASDVSEDISNFAYLVYLDSSNFDFSKAKSDGSDIRLTDGAGNLLSFFREKHDSTNQVAIYHVKIPTVSSSTDTTIYLYYGNSNATDGSSDFQTVFGDSGLVAYYPFDGNANDLSGNYNGTETKVNYGNGYIDKALYTNIDYTSHVEVDNIPPIFDESNKSFFCWMNVDSNALNNIIATSYTSLKNGTRVVFSHNMFSVYQGTNISWTAPSDGWHFIGFTVDSGGVKVYIDGNIVTTDSRTTINDSGNGYYPYYAIGNKWYNIANNSNGTPNTVLDMMRIYNTALSSTQVSLLYKIESKTLFSFGNEQRLNNTLWFGTNF